MGFRIIQTIEMGLELNGSLREPGPHWNGPSMGLELNGSLGEPGPHWNGPSLAFGWSFILGTSSIRLGILVVVEQLDHQANMQKGNMRMVRRFSLDNMLEVQATVFFFFFLFSFFGGFVWGWEGINFLLAQATLG